jgi:prepilin-type N-terminal cleavage/methylation domain-containing protein
MKKNDGFTLIELLVTLVIVGVIMTFIISMMSSQYAIIRDVDAYLVLSAENKDVNDQVIQEFVATEDILIDLDDGNGYKSILLPENSGTSGYFVSDGVPMKNIRLSYTKPSDHTAKVIVTFGRGETETNELVMKRYTNSVEDTNLIDTVILGEHLAAGIDPQVAFYRRLSQDRRVVSLVKVKINYLHDGITKQYDLFYHLRNLQFN